MQDTAYFILPNGMRLVHRRVKSPVAYTGVMVGAGTRDELEKESGMAHYIEHCVFKGTETRTAKQIINRIEGIGGEINAYTTKEETVYYAASLPQYVGRTMELLSDMLMHPRFDKKETDKELQVILDEIESYNDSPSELIYDDFEATVFSGYPIARPILGSKRSLKTFTREKVLAFMARTYRPERMVLFVQANLPFEKVKTLALAYFSDWSGLKPGDSSDSSDSRNPSGPSSPRTSTPYIYTPARVSYHRHTHQAHAMIGGRAYPLGHERQLMLYLMNNILGGGAMNSRLNLSLREQKGLVYTVESQYTPLSDTGYWSVYFACDPENKQQCVELVEQELSIFREREITPTSLRRALRQMRGQMAISAENQENSALTMAKHMLYFGQVYSWMDSYDKMLTFTPEQLQEVARETYEPSQLSYLFYE